MKRYIRNVILAAFFFQVSCANVTGKSLNGNEFVIDEEITTETVAEVELWLEEPTTGPRKLIITSEGGRGRASILIALLIQQNDLEVEIGRFCLSSCAEFIFPSTAKISYSRNSIIGFHGNPLLEQHLLREAGETGPFCGEGAAGAMDFVYQKSGADTEFWRSQMRTLKPYDVVVVEGPDCKTVEYKREIETWLPSQIELEEFLGRKLPGPVCADDPECVRNRVTPLFGSERAFVAAGVKYPAI